MSGLPGSSSPTSVADEGNPFFIHIHTWTLFFDRPRFSQIMQNATPNAQGNALQAWLAAGLPLTLLSPALDLPAEVVQLILIHIPTHYIALLAPTCRALSVAARNAQRANRHWFSGTIVTLGGYTHVTMLNAVCHVECDSCYDDDDDDDDEYYDEYYDGRRLFCSCGATSCCLLYTSPSPRDS